VTVEGGVVGDVGIVLLGRSEPVQEQERLAIAVEGDVPFGPMKVKLVVDVSAVRADQIA
jgi:hypothetical protein